ncbi:MAG: ATP-dependent RecD-like DNA helicase [Phycisphaeraceae bacterium]|nr:ATP-dependent RecD-like DNA helicase [Phycisphaeraceae bacterium]
MVHLSARLVWHDRAWDGHVCDQPGKNVYCVAHKHVREAFRDPVKVEREEKAASLPLLELDGWRPPCSRDPLAFSRVGAATMHEDPLERRALLPVPEKLPPYSICPSPYLWMREDNFRFLCEREGLALPGPKNPKKEKGWVAEPGRQKALLSHFWGKLQKKQSLVFFYCKDGHPFAEHLQRILVGVSRISEIGEQLYFGSTEKNPAERYPIWSRRITHDFEHQGVRLPYQEYLRGGHDSARILCRIPDADTFNFSYVAEHVTDDVAVGALTRLLQSVQAVRDDGKVPGDWDASLERLNDMLAEVWRNRGPFPGIGSVLEFLNCPSGTAFQKQVLAPLLAKGENSWEYTLAILDGRRKCEHKEYTKALGEAAERWTAFKAPRRNLLALLARFELSRAQVERIAKPDLRAACGIAGTEEQIVANAYLLCEQDQGDGESDLVGLETIDRGMRPEGDAAHFLAKEDVCGADDRRRVRAAAVAVLQTAASDGDTLLPFAETIQRINALFPERRACRPDRDLVIGQADYYREVLDFRTDVTPATAALKSLADLERQVCQCLAGRVKRKNAPPKAGWSWERLLLEEFGKSGSKLPPEVEERARKEKADALAKMYEGRISVLCGRAGTGKTSVLNVFLKGLEQIEGKKPILLLAPTGKARVRMMERTKRDDALTIHQFLMHNEWINKTNFALKLEGGAAKAKPTVIVDEASMIPMDLLGVLFRALEMNDVKRLILVGDPNQLPPIGPGRPFVDIIAWLEADEQRKKYLARLTERARHEDHESQALQLADCYLRDDPTLGADEVLSRVARKEVAGDLEVWYWQNTSQLEEHLAASMKKHLGLTDDKKSYIPFNASLGITDAGMKPPEAERWQILCPVRTDEHGTNELNRKIQAKYRGGLLASTKSFGDQEIVWTDKVIQSFNRRMLAWPRNTGLDYVANGEIGLVVKTFKEPACLDVGFSTQPDVTYRYFSGQVNENLELAYALTVHRAQGSDFETVFLVLPKRAATLSRELLYTGLTRFRRRMVLLIEKDTAVLEEQRSPACSDTLLRNTNMFVLSVRPEADDRWHAAHLIHRTKPTSKYPSGVLVQSKSEVIVANILTDLGLSWEYEQKLLNKNNNPTDFRWPDFTVNFQGDTFYWEHRGMLGSPTYKDRWVRKEQWYKDNGYFDQLITSEDGLDGSIDAAQIEATARRRVLGT